MADIRCPNCGKENPDFLDVCQFCQTPLKRESTVHIGDKPTKKNTGELENVLPEWLRDVRQQARDSAEANAAQEASKPKIQKDEPLDLLAGLAFQSDKADEEEVPDWLSSLRSTTKEEKSALPSPAPATDFFAQFDQSKPAHQEETPSRMSEPSQESSACDELSDWFTKASEEPAEPLPFESDSSQTDLGWGVQAEATPASEQSAPKEAEDLSWLHNLEDESKKTGELSKSKEGTDWFADFSTPSTPEQPSGQEDLSWLNRLGAIPPSDEPSQQPSESKEDLSWLNNLGGTPVPEQPSQAQSQPQEDLSWLNQLGETSQSQQPIEQTPSVSGQQTTQNDLDWLANLQGSADSLSAAPFADQSSALDQPKSDEESAEAPRVSPFMPRRTAPLGEEDDTSIPDWLKSAAEGPSMPLGADALDQFREDYKIPTGPEEAFSWKNFVPEAKSDEEQSPPSKPAPAFVDSNPPIPAGDASTLSNQDVDSLFSVDMPDWLSHPATEEKETPQQEVGIHAEGGEALAPADLPSWVQAMRPVEAVLSETAAVADQPTESVGPLAGFKGIIPAVPIGSSRRPQPIPLKLQATDEQQASAAIMEQILVSETSPRALLSAPTFSSQRTLRIVLAVLVWVILGAVILMHTQFMPVSSVLPSDVEAASKTVESISDNSAVLVIMDYEPSLAGEMEATSGPLLNHLVLLRRPSLSFISTSPNGSGLVDRLMKDINISTLAQEHLNLGYLPGGEAGVLAFLRSPQNAIPSANVTGFSDYKAIIMLTDHADSARVWIEQLQTLKQADPTLTNQPLLVVSSAQAGPMLQPYVSSQQINGLVNGLADAARYEQKNNVPPGLARSYWDAFGAGIILAVVLIVVGSLWSLFAGMRARRAEAGEG